MSITSVRGSVLPTQQPRQQPQRQPGNSQLLRTVYETPHFFPISYPPNNPNPGFLSYEHYPLFDFVNPFIDRNQLVVHKTVFLAPDKEKQYNFREVLRFFSDYYSGESSTTLLVSAKKLFDEAMSRACTDVTRGNLLLYIQSLVMHAFYDTVDAKGGETSVEFSKTLLTNFEGHDISGWIAQNNFISQFRHRKDQIGAFASFMKREPKLHQYVLADCILNALKIRLFNDAGLGFLPGFMHDNTRSGLLNPQENFPNFPTMDFPFWDAVLQDFQQASIQSRDRSRFANFRDKIHQIKTLNNEQSTVFFGFFKPKGMMNSEGKHCDLYSSHAFVARFYKFDHENYGMALQNFGLGQVDSARPKADLDMKANALKGPVFFYYGSDFSHVEKTVKFLFDYSLNPHGAQEFTSSFSDLIKAGQSFIKAGETFARNQDLPFGFLKDPTFFYEEKPGGFCTSLSMCADLKQVVGQAMYRHKFTYEGAGLNTLSDSNFRAVGLAAYSAMQFSIIEEFQAQVGPYIDVYPGLYRATYLEMESIKICLKSLKETPLLLDMIPEPFQSKIRSIPDPRPPVDPVVIPAVSDSSCNCIVS